MEGEVESPLGAMRRPASPLDPGSAPRFDGRARGMPQEWRKVDALAWRAGGRGISQAERAATKVDKVLQFLARRLDARGRPVSKLFGEPEWVLDGRAFRLPWKAFSADDLPTASTQPGGGSQASWRKAWHETQFEALYATVIRGRLCASLDYR